MNNPIRLFRDVIIGENGEGDLIDKRGFVSTESIESELNVAYNKGVDDAIKIMERLANGSGTQAELVSVISKHTIIELESLKK